MKPTVHSMKRRSNAHDYSRCGYYHITISVAHTLQQPFGKITGRLESPDGTADAPHVELSAIGRMVEEELRERIHKYYPMLEVQDYVIMPEHLHFLLVAHRHVVSQNGKPTHLGHVIAGFKYGCNKRYWEMTGMISPATKSPDTMNNDRSATTALGDSVAPNNNLPASTALGDSVAKPLVKPSLPPLFDAGYCDVMPVDEAQLATQRAYIRSNPRNRLLRQTYRSRLHPQRGTIDTAVSPNALRGYLERECPRQLTTEAFASIESRLLQDAGRIKCDSYGSLALLSRRLLPVVCHRKDAALFVAQKARCLEEAASGAVLVSARIAKGEQEIMDSALHSGYPTVRIEDNGFPEIYHPSADRTDDCAASLLLLLTPWRYQFRAHDESISVPFCKTMNCLAQAICRTKDDWWKSVGNELEC